MSDEVLLTKIMDLRQKSQTLQGSFDFELTSQSQHSQVLNSEVTAYNDDLKIDTLTNYQSKVRR